MTITKAEAAELFRLLDVLSDFLEGAIESTIPRPIPAEEPARREVLLTAEVRDKYAPEIELDRQDWRAVENWKLRLEQAL